VHDAGRLGAVAFGVELTFLRFSIRSNEGAFRMSTSDNKKVVEELITFSGDDPLGGLSDDVRWTVMGTTVFSGTFNGKQEMVEKLYGPLIGQLQGPGSIDVQNIVADGDYVVLQARRRTASLTTGGPTTIRTALCCASLTARSLRATSIATPN
jgi:hypothetical protein